MADEADTPRVARRRTARRSSSRAGSSSSCCRSRVLALYALAHAAGVVLLLFIVAAVIALILNPLVSFVQRARLPRTLAVIAVYVGFFTPLPVLGFLLAGPVADQATIVRRRRPGLVDDANATLDDLQAFFDDNGIDVQIKGQSDSALASLQDQLVEGSGEIVVDHRRAAAPARRAVVLHDPRRRPVDLHAHLRAADRRARAHGDAARRRHAARTTTRRACSTRSSATSAGSCCSA